MSATRRSAARSSPGLGSGLGSELPLEQEDPWIGATVGGRYEIERLLGLGSLARVYLAHHKALRKSFAIKILDADDAMVPEQAARFVRGARAAASIDSEHVVRISDFGLTGEGAAYLVMENLEGQSLRQLLAAEGALAPERCLNIARQVCSGLAAAHAAGIVHRDLRPEKVRLVQRAEGLFCKIADFGLAKPVDEAQEGVGRISVTGAALGAPEYMAPEQMHCQPVDARCDVYALGVTMYEMATGAPPLQADSLIGMFRLHQTAAIAPIRSKDGRAHFPAAFEAVVLRCLQEAPEDRYPSAVELRRALDEIG